MRNRPRKLRSLSVLGVAAALLISGAAPSQAAAGTSTCRASVLRVQGQGLLPGLFSEPVVVQNQAGQPCTPLSDELLSFTLPVGLGSLQVGPASTSVFGTASHPTATTTVAGPTLTLLGLPAISATVLQSTATAGVCKGQPKSPKLSSSSLVAGLTIGGVPVNIGTAPTTINLGVATLYLNRKIVGPTSVTQRAFELDVPLLADIVLAEAQAGFTSNPCA